MVRCFLQFRSLQLFVFSLCAGAFFMWGEAGADDCDNELIYFTWDRLPPLSSAKVMEEPLLIAFQVAKSLQISDVTAIPLADNHYEISWESSPDVPVVYSIFHADIAPAEFAIGNRFVVDSSSACCRVVSHTDEIAAKGYTKSPYVSDEAWAAVQPYLLPENNPLKGKLDQIFRGSRATASRQALVNAGFTYTQKQGSHVITAKHSKLSGVVIKLLTDDNPNPDEWKGWVQRVKGAQLIQQGINEFKSSRYFKVPKKWIYPLPPEPSPSGVYRRNFILIAEDMKLLPYEDNKMQWRCSKDKKRLEALYKLQQKYGLNDSVRIANIPMCRDGRVAFVDTEVYYWFPVDYHPLLEYISTSLWDYWKQLTGLKKSTSPPLR